MKIVRRRRYPRPKPPTPEEKQTAWDLFESGSEQAIREYIEAETAKVRAKWDRLDELRRRGISADEEPRVELVSFLQSVSRRHVMRAEY